MAEKMTEAQMAEFIAEKAGERAAHAAKLVEKYSKVAGLGFKNGKLEEMMNKDADKTANLLFILENTEKQAYNNNTLLANLNKVRLQKENKVSESLQVGGEAALLLPSDIVKLSRIAYTNSVADELFDVWGMSSMKDSIWKLIKTTGQAERGVSAGSVIVETPTDGRYPTTIEQASMTLSGSDTTVTLLGPAIPFRCTLLDSTGKVIGADDGFGALWADVSGTKTEVGAINYATGVVTPNSDMPASTTMEYAADFENKTYMDAHTASTLIDLKEFPFVARLNPQIVEWTRYAEDMFQSKLGVSAKAELIAGAADEYRKDFDERAITQAIRATKSWASGVTYSADWKTQGGVSSYDFAQNVQQAFGKAEMLTYKALNRWADKTNYIVSADVYTYLTKNNRFHAVAPASKMGVCKVGEFEGGHGVYLAPDSLLGVSGTGAGKAYVIGKANEGMSTDAVVSVGTYGAQMVTPEMNYPNFHNAMGIGSYEDMKIMNAKFASVVNFTDLNAM